MDAAPQERLFEPLRVGGMALANRIAVAPMTRVSATAEGVPTDRMAAYYTAFARGGFGLIITEGLYTDRAYSQGYLFQPGLTDDAQQIGWARVVRGVHAQGAPIVAQLMHAGALSQGNRFRRQTRAPSAVQPKGEQLSFYRGGGAYALPVTMSQADIDEALGGFAASASRAKDAGFDGVEIHAANGYLLDQFLTEGLNVRTDAYGGSLTRRLRLLQDVVGAVRQAVGGEFVIGVRISQGKVNDFHHTWSGGERDAATLFGALGALPIDYLHVTAFEAWRPAFGDGPSLAALAKRHVPVPVLANGSLEAPERAAALLHAGEADAISIGRGALTHPDWPRRVQAGQAIEAFDREWLSPIADLATAERQRRAG